MQTFHAMGTEISVVAPALAPVDEAALAAQIRALFADREARFSRFRADSELSRLNRAVGPIPASAALRDTLRDARRWNELTGGVFDPAIGAALIANGYDRSFAPGALDRDAAASVALPGGCVRDVIIDDDAGTVTRPRELLLDLGGVVKGRTVDEAAALLPDGAAVDAGGDLVARGAPAGEAAWTIDVDDPTAPGGEIVTLAVRDRAVATSSTHRRRWRLGDAVAHHVIDPRTGQPSASDLQQVTVIAATAELAEVLAKSILVLGTTLGRRLLAGWPGAGAVLVDHAGAMTFAGDVELTDD